MSHPTRSPFPFVLLAAALATSAAPLLAHGGQYRGPSGVVPPSSGSSSSGGGAASGPTGGATSGGGTAAGGGGSATNPGPTGPAAPSAGKVGGGGAALGPDLGRWQYWWEFNKDETLALRATLKQQAMARDLGDELLGTTAAVDVNQRRPPSSKEIGELVRPALLAVLQAEEQRDLVSGAMVALAKVSRGEAEVRDQFVRRLRSRDQEIRETAALALGIAGNAEALPMLADLFADSEAGRVLVERSSVDVRTRAFAGYGLGLLGAASKDPLIKLRVWTALKPLLATDQVPDRNLRTAAVLGLRMLELDENDPRQRALRDEVAASLRAYWQAGLGVGEEYQQAHVPVTLSRLHGRGTSAQHQELKQLLLAELRASKPRSEPLRQSAILALGQLALAAEDFPGDALVSQTLRKTSENARDWQERVYGLQALGQIGGAENRRFLLDRLARGRQLEQAWSALALGFAARAAGRADEEAGAAMQRGLREVKDPEVRGAFAVALGLCDHRAAVDDVRKMMRDYRHQDELCGYLCIGLSLLGDKASVPALQDVVADSMRRPDLLKQAAVALGRLGDHRAIAQLRDVLLAPDVSVARLAAVASALSRIGDQRCLEPLLQILGDSKQIPLCRAFAAVALGGMCDKSPLPWNAAIGRDLNYRAAVETLTSDGSGVLDIF